MAIALIILSALLWIAALWLLTTSRQMLAPAASYLALYLVSLAKVDGAPLLPFNNVILIGWLAMTLVVMCATMLQAPALQAQTRGTGYITAGAAAGMVVGLLGYTVTSSGSMIYSIMILATALGTFLGFLMFSRTPQGADVGISTGRFFKYLLAKGFPAAITVMMIGVAAVLAIAVTQY